MQFLYLENAGAAHIEVGDEEHKYLFKVRREQVGNGISLRNLKDGYDYRYTITSIDKKSAFLHLESKEMLLSKSRTLHLCWAVIDPKTIEKTLPLLNELGISKITFFYADRSQKNFSVNLERLNKILISSCGQCGRNNLMDIEILDSTQTLLQTYQNLTAIHFSKTVLSNNGVIASYAIGPEGGFSKEELKLFKEENIVGLKTETVLKSETAAVAVASFLRLL